MAQQEKGNKQKYTCAVCGQTFNSEREQREHGENEHPGFVMGSSSPIGQSGGDRRNPPNR